MIHKAISVATAAAAYPVTAAMVKAWARIDGTADDLWISYAIDRATGLVEDRINRALINRTYDLFMDGFDDEDYVLLPYPPLSSVTGIYYSTTSATEVSPSTAFAATNYVVDTNSVPGRIFLVDGCVWPTGLRDYNSVRIRYVAGYGAADTAVPWNIKGIILELITYWYRNRGDYGAVPDVLLSQLGEVTVFQ